MADVETGISHAFVKSNAGDGTACVRPKRNAQFDSTSRTAINGSWHCRARPDSLLG